MTDLFTGTLIRLCAPRPEDSIAFSRWTHDPDYIRQVDTDYARPFTIQQMEEQMKPSGGNTVYFHLRTLADDTFIGFVVLHSIEWNNQSALMAIGIGEAAYRGKGYGGDALRLILNYAFQELNLYRVGLDVIASNERAVHAYEKAGFRHEGACRGAVCRDGKRIDRMIMGILRDEWKA